MFFSGVVAGHHTLADILMPGHLGHDFPNRIGYGGHRNDPYIDEIGNAMPFGDPMPYGGHVNPLSLVDTLAHGHPLGGAFNSPADVRPYGRPLDPRPYGSPSDPTAAHHIYGHGSPLELRHYSRPVDSRPYGDSLRDPMMRQECPQTCDLKAWPRCQCLSPATYSDDGRGNCNVGAMNNDLQARKVA